MLCSLWHQKGQECKDRPKLEVLAHREYLHYLHRSNSLKLSTVITASIHPLSEPLIQLTCTRHSGHAASADIFTPIGKIYVRNKKKHGWSTSKRLSPLISCQLPKKSQTCTVCFISFLFLYTGYNSGLHESVPTAADRPVLTITAFSYAVLLDEP